MSTSQKKAGTYELKSFKVYKLGQPAKFKELFKVIPYWELTESMNSGHIYGYAYVIDSQGILDYFIDGSWLKGEEEIQIVYTDFYEEIEMTHRMFLYSITEVERKLTANETAIAYKIHFVSIDKFFTERELIRRSYRRETIDKYVESVFEEYYKKYNSDAEILIEDKPDGPSGNQWLVVPNYSPEQTMHFFARRAYSESNATGTFRFFQNRDQYYFTTHENLIDGDGPIGNPNGNNGANPFFFQVNEVDQSTVGQLILMQNIISIETPQHINTMGDMLDGGYYKSTVELDILSKLVWKTEYRYLDEYQEYDLPDSVNHDNLLRGNINPYNKKSPNSILPNETRSKHSKKFIDEHLNLTRDTIVVKDYDHVDERASASFDLRPSPYYNKVFNQKHVNHYHHMNEMLTIRIYGRNDLKAGSLIQLEFLKANSDLPKREIDVERSGTYLVESARNIFDENNYYQVLSISKSGFTGKQEAPSSYYKDPFLINYDGKSAARGVSPGSNSSGSTNPRDTTNPSDRDQPPISDATIADGRLPRNEVEQKVYDGMLERGIPEHVAQGFMMNFEDESNFDIDITEGQDNVHGTRGKGLYQLTGSRRAQFEAKYGNNYSIDNQLDFMMSELNTTEKGARDKIWSTDNAGDAGAAIVSDFLRPAEQHRKSRVRKYKGSGLS